MRFLSNLIEKLNPAQEEIVENQGEKDATTINPYTVTTAYTNIEVVQRGTNMIVDSSAPIRFDVKEKIRGLGVLERQVPAEKVKMLVNFKPNMFQDADAFFRNVYTDLVLEGNAFIYFDGAYMYNLPATNVEIVKDKKKFINHYVYGNDTKMYPHEVIFVKENSSHSIFRGESRLLSALGSINTLNAMVDFQENFFKNNAIPGMILKTANILSPNYKKRLIREWIVQYNPRRGGRRPMILDGDFDVKDLGKTDFRELDFVQSVEIHEKKILKALGVPPILLDSGNNANISPNLKLFYLMTILPLVAKVGSAMEFFFGYDLKADVRSVMALRPELKDEAEYFTAFVNAGIMKRNEAREAIRLEKSDDEIADKLILPANVAGSAVDPSQGGAPKKPKKEGKEE